MADADDRERRWRGGNAFEAAGEPASATCDRKFAPAAARNQLVIVDVLKGFLPAVGKVLEVGSGTGQHIAAFASAFPGLTWIPSDVDPQSRASTQAWIAEGGQTNVVAPLALDLSRPDWVERLEGPIEAVICNNVIHIAPWTICNGLLRGAGKLLSAGGILFLYGPYKVDGQHVSDSNEEFDRSLRHRNPEWGVRDIDEVEAVAQIHHLQLDQIIEMPANNRSLVLIKQG